MALGLFLGLTVQAKADYDFTTIDVPDSTLTNARGINSSGQIVGLFEDPGGTRHGYLLSEDGYTTLDPPGSTRSAAQAINDLGAIVGSYYDQDGVRHGYLLSEDGYTTLDPPGSTDTLAYGINDLGEIVAGSRRALPPTAPTDPYGRN
jgi:uncharacterized membrane protein